MRVRCHPKKKLDEVNGTVSIVLFHVPAGVPRVPVVSLFSFVCDRVIVSSCSGAIWEVERRESGVCGRR
jgi:hypothetical protein